jgi:hypothetical protein
MKSNNINTNKIKNQPTQSKKTFSPQPTPQHNQQTNNRHSKQYPNTAINHTTDSSAPPRELPTPLGRESEGGRGAKGACGQGWSQDVCIFLRSSFSNFASVVGTNYNFFRSCLQHHRLNNILFKASAPPRESPTPLSGESEGGHGARGACGQGPMQWVCFFSRDSFWKRSLRDSNPLIGTN